MVESGSKWSAIRYLCGRSLEGGGETRRGQKISKKLTGFVLGGDCGVYESVQSYG